jgi:D-alanyl-D-alanine carboxypeptidase/D-alanyl-D-alanine-endopeptidase (penicillin-binding protein 4)
MRGHLFALVVIAAASFAAPVDAGPSRPTKPTVTKRTGTRGAGTKATTPTQPKARIAVSILGATRPPAEQRRKKGPLTEAERIADAIETLYKGPLRAGVTSLYVADARTGAPLFAVDADAPLNPASNVKLIATATALDLLGPEFRYLTRVLGRQPDAATGEAGDLYLLGSYDPTLRVDDLHKLAADLAASGIKKLSGDVVVGQTATRDGIYRALIPVELVASPTPGDPVVTSTPAGYDFVQVVNTATVGKKKRGNLKFTEKYVTDEAGRLRLQLTITGQMGKDKTYTHWLWTRERALHAAYALRAGLRAVGVEVTGEVRIEAFDDVVTSAAADGYIPLELARHESAPLGHIVAQVNKRSINWLADRVVMTAAARAYGGVPSMQGAIEAMYKWLGTHTTYDREDLLVDTGSGLSRQTRFSAHQIVDVLRAASGLATDSAVDEERANAYLASLSIAGTDGTLRRRFRNSDAETHLHGKTGTLRDVVALSGILDLDPDRPIAFALVTNGHPESLKVRVKHAHEDLVGLLCDYVQATKPAAAKPAAPVLPKVTPAEVPAAPNTTTAPIEPPTRDGEDIEETDDGTPEVSPDREDIEYMVEQDKAGPIVAPTTEETDAD